MQDASSARVNIIRGFKLKSLRLTNKKDRYFINIYIQVTSEQVYGYSAGDYRLLMLGLFALIMVSSVARGAPYKGASDVNIFLIKSQLNQADGESREF